MITTQTAFRKGLLDPQVPAPEGVINPDGTAATKRFDVYRNNVAVSLSDALETAFPVVRKLVGDEFFRAMAGVYLRKHPPKSPLMMFYGDAMPQFLSRFEPVKHLKYLPDVAKVELAMRESYHAAEIAPVSADALGAIEPDALMGLKMTFAPSMHLIQSKFPIHGIYLHNTRDDAPAPASEAEAILITRPEFDPQLHKLDTDAANALSSLIDGQPLGIAMNAASEALDLGGLLGQLLQQGVITELKT